MKVSDNYAWNNFENGAICNATNLKGVIIIFVMSRNREHSEFGHIVSGEQQKVINRYGNQLQAATCQGARRLLSQRSLSHSLQHKN
jgi:hypothetical protein